MSRSKTIDGLIADGCPGSRQSVEREDWEVTSAASYTSREIKPKFLKRLSHDLSQLVKPFQEKKLFVKLKKVELPIYPRTLNTKESLFCSTRRSMNFSSNLSTNIRRESNKFSQGVFGKLESNESPLAHHRKIKMTDILRMSSCEVIRSPDTDENLKRPIINLAFPNRNVQLSPNLAKKELKLPERTKLRLANLLNQNNFEKESRVLYLNSYKKMVQLERSEIQENSFKSKLKQRTIFLPIQHPKAKAPKTKKSVSFAKNILVCLFKKE